MRRPDRPAQGPIFLRDGSRPRTPVVTIALILANGLAFWYGLTLGESGLAGFLDLWGVVPQSLSSFFTGADFRPGVLVTPLTSMYLHVGSLHLATNMLYLWVFGSAVEHLLGRWRFLLFYTACGLAAVVVQVVAWPASTIPAVGASGAIAGLLAAYLVLRPGATIAVIAPVLFFFPSVDVPAVLMMGLWFLSQFFSGLASLATGATAGTAAWLAHIGGFLGGFVFVFLLRPPRKSGYLWRRS